jgi:hypothetical protein
MRIFVVGGESRDLAAIENALRLGEVEILTAAAPIPAGPDQRRYAFAGWTLDAATRDLANPVGRRVNLTSSEYDLLKAFVRQPGPAAVARSAARGLERARLELFRPLDRHPRRAPAQEDRLRTRPAAADPLRTRDRICVLRQRLVPAGPRPIRGSVTLERVAI